MKPLLREHELVWDSRSVTPGTHSFEAQFRNLVLDSHQRSTEPGNEPAQERWHRLRFRQWERRGLELTSVEGEGALHVTPSLVEVSSLRSATSFAWLMTIVLLLVAIGIFGFRSAWTGVADFALIALTLARFFLDSTRRRSKRTSQAIALEPEEPARLGESATPA